MHSFRKLTVDVLAVSVFSTTHDHTHSLYTSRNVSCPHSQLPRLHERKMRMIYVKFYVTQLGIPHEFNLTLIRTWRRPYVSSRSCKRGKCHSMFIWAHSVSRLFSRLTVHTLCSSHSSRCRRRRTWTGRWCSGGPPSRTCSGTASLSAPSPSQSQSCRRTAAHSSPPLTLTRTAGGGCERQQWPLCALFHKAFFNSFVGCSL